MFFYLESEGLLERDNGGHLFAFHFVYLPRINSALKEFVGQWSNHAIRTAGNLSPRQLNLNGFLEVHNSNYTAVENIYAADQGTYAYGVDDSDEVEIDSNNNVHVPQLKFSLRRSEFVSPRRLSSFQTWILYNRVHVDYIMFKAKSSMSNGKLMFLYTFPVICGFIALQLYYATCK